MKLPKYWWVAIIALVLLQNNTIDIPNSPMFAMERFADSYVDSGDLDLDVGNIDKSDSTLRSTVSQYNALITYERVQDDTAYYTIEVSDSNRDAMVEDLKQIGDVTSYTDSAYYAGESLDSYTEQLAAEQARYDRYQELYLEAVSVEDKLLITDRMFESEQSIAYYQDLLNNTQDRVSTTTLSVSLSKDAWLDNFVTLKMMRDQVVDSFNFMVSSLFWLIPWMLVYGVYRLIKRWKQ